MGIPSKARTLAILKRRAALAAAMEDVATRKRELRRRVGAAMETLPPARRVLEEEIVQAAVQSDPVWQAARTVLLYKAVPPELSVVGLTLAAWREGKRTLFPRIVGPGELALHAVSSWSDLAAGTHGIPEPAAALPVVGAAGVDLAIVPGVAWGPGGLRLGRGGGYYDRLIPRLGGPAWGVGFDCQWVEDLPMDAWDAPVARSWVPTPSGLL